MRMQIRKIVFEDVEVDAYDLLSLADSARVLGMTLQGVRSLMDRGGLTELIDPDALGNRRVRFTLRLEVEELAARRLSLAEKWGEKEARD